MKKVNEKFIGTELIITEYDGTKVMIPLEDGSGFNGVKGRNTYTCKYYIDYGIHGATCLPAKNLSTIVRRLESDYNRDLSERKKINIEIKS
jgi:hypothetical protein